MSVVSYWRFSEQKISLLGPLIIKFHTKTEVYWQNFAAAHSQLTKLNWTMFTPGRQTSQAGPPPAWRGVAWPGGGRWLWCCHYSALRERAGREWCTTVHSLYTCTHRSPLPANFWCWICKLNFKQKDKSFSLKLTEDSEDRAKGGVQYNCTECTLRREPVPVERPAGYPSCPPYSDSLSGAGMHDCSTLIL